MEEEKSNIIKFSEEKSSHIQVLSEQIKELNKKIKNMEEVLIYRGFEKQNINSENIKTIKVNKTKEEPKENKIYTVQIATYGNKVNISEIFKGLSNVFFKKTDNKTFSYMSGRFTNSNDAFEHKNNLINMGYKNAFIITISE